MPYGSYNTVKDRQVDAYNYDSSGNLVQTKLKVGFASYPDKLSISRSGTNTSSKMCFAKRLPKYQGPYEYVPFVFNKVTETDPALRRLRFAMLKYENGLRRLNNEAAKADFKVWKLTRSKSKVKAARGLDLSPNRLNFDETYVVFDPSNEVVVRHTNNSYRKYVGDLVANFTPLGALSAISGDAAYWLGPSESSLLTNARAEADLKSITAFYERVKNEKVNLANAVAERAQTMGMFVDLFKRLAKGLSAGRRGDFLGAAKALLPGSKLRHVISDNILLYHFGIKPLIADIQGVAEALANEEEFKYDVKKSKSSKVPRTLVATYTNSLDIQCVTRVYVQVDVRVIYKARIKVTSEVAKVANQLGLTNPISPLWEVTPWSFVVDWVFPFGNWLSNVTAFTGLSLDHVTKTVFSRETIEFERSFGGTNGGYTTQSKTVRAVKVRTRCDRTILTIVPPLPAPILKNPLSATHVTEAISLLSQHFK